MLREDWETVFNLVYFLYMLNIIKWEVCSPIAELDGVSVVSAYVKRLGGGGGTGLAKK
jgi:hypothetical protein